MNKRQRQKERNSTELTQKAILRKTSNLSDKEIQLWHAEFLRKYPNGKLDKNTFHNTYQELCPQTNRFDSCEILFNIIDSNSDNTIDFNEFLFLATIGNRMSNLEERLDIIFDLWDVSNDGLLDQNELAHLISAMYDRFGVKNRQGDQDPYRRAKAIINKLDVNGDQKLNKEEFINGCKNDQVIRKLLAPDP